jgi:hypothetical protein
MFEHELKNFLKQHKEYIMSVNRIKELPARIVMPMPEHIIFEKKQLHKLYGKQVITKQPFSKNLQVNTS